MSEARYAALPDERRGFAELIYPLTYGKTEG